MLVTFSSSATSDLVVFSDVAHRLLEVIGKQPTALGVLTPDQYSEALWRLKNIPPSKSDGGSEHGHPLHDIGAGRGTEAHENVGLDVRAHPLVEMIRQAEVEKVSILWRASSDF